MGKETVVKVHHSEELLQGLHAAGAGESGYSLHLGGEGDGSLWNDMLSEEGDGRPSKLALGRSNDEAVFAEPLKQLLKVCHVLFRGCAGHKNVVQVRHVS